MVKHFFEQYARLLLTHQFGFAKENLFCDDKPDIQSRDGSTGIEVTRDIYEKEAEFHRRMEDIWYKPYSDIPAEKKEKLLQKYKIDVNGDRIIVASLKNGITENTPKRLIECILKKVKKLNSGGYAKFDDYQLYVYVDSVILDGCESYVLNVMDAVKHQRAALNYSFLYLDQWYVVYVCDINTGTYRKIAVSNELRENLGKEALGLCPD